MKRIVILLVCTLLIGHLQADEMKAAWKEAAKIEKNIKRTKFPKRDYNILDFGAVANDSAVLNHDAINNAILECSLNGGGRVVVPQGDFYTGPIRLRSNVNLYIPKGAALKFSTRKELYLPAVLTRWEGIDCYNAHPLIYAYGETNIALTGKGVLDG